MLHTAYLVSLFEDTNLAAIHAKRVTMQVYPSRRLPQLLTYVLPTVNPKISLSPAACAVSALKLVFDGLGSVILCKPYICTPLVSTIV